MANSKSDLDQPSSATMQSSIFDEVIDRKKHNSLKWTGHKFFLTGEQSAADPLPMWIADMDFRAPPAVINALQSAVANGDFGYPGGPTDDYLNAVIGWQRRRFNWQVHQDWLVQTPGIVTALKIAIQAFTEPGDSVLIQPPVYAHFHTDVLMNNRQVACAPLVANKNSDGFNGYQFDADVFEASIRPNTKLFILSHPHNPTGNVWSEQELTTMGEICLRHGILIITDEIHQDLILNRHKKHIPFASLNSEFQQHSITCTSASKTFNLAGLQCANLIIPNPNLRKQYWQQYEKNMTPFVNGLGPIATQAAYQHGEPWLEALLEYLRGNHQYFASCLNEANLGVRILPADSLFLAWMDCRVLNMNPQALAEFMFTQANVWLEQGQTFGTEGEGFMRINLGCPRATLVEASDRILGALKPLQS